MGQTKAENAKEPETKLLDANEKKLRFEDILEVVGSKNRFQIFIYFALNACIEYSASCATTYFIIEGASPGFTCLDCLNYTSGEEKCASFGNITKDKCELLSDCHNLTFNTNFTSIITEWYLICERKWMKQLVASIFFLGLFFGVMVMGQVSDKFGRKLSLVPCWCVMIVFQSLLAVAPSYPVYVLFRFIVGLCVGCLATNGAVLPAEYIHPKWRPIVEYRIGWTTGSMSTALMAFLIPNWRHLCLATGLITVPLVPFFIYFVPESARWYLEKGKLDQAEKCLLYVARINGRKVTELKGMLAKVHGAEKPVEMNFTHLFRSRKTAMRSVVLIFHWLASSLMFYGLSNQISDMSGNMYLNTFLFSLGLMLTSWSIVFVANWIGRRITLLVTLGTAGLCLLAIMVMDITGFVTSNPMVVTYFALSAFIIANLSWCVGGLYALELYPTLLRNTATAAGSMGARIGSICAPQIALLSTLHRSAPYVFIGSIALISASISFFVLPETKGKPLPENTSDIEVKDSEEMIDPGVDTTMI